jgi:hypothetical protein
MLATPAMPKMQNKKYMFFMAGCSQIGGGSNAKRINKIMVVNVCVIR